MSFEQGPEGLVVDLTRYRQEKNSAAFSEMMAPIVVSGAADMGLADEFLGILGKHVNDLEVEFDQHELPSRLDLEAVGGAYQRIAKINTHNRSLRARHLESAVASSGVRISREQALQLATEWCFFELCGDALSNSCYMQMTYDRYVPETNLQSTAWLAENTVAENFMKEMASEDFSESDVRKEHEGFRAGFALAFLEKSLVRYGFTDSVSKSKMITNALRVKYIYSDNRHHRELLPHSTTEVAERLSMIKPRKTSAELDAYILALGNMPDDE